MASLTRRSVDMLVLGTALVAPIKAHSRRRLMEVLHRRQHHHMSTTMALKTWTRSVFACRITLLVDMSSEVTQSISRLREKIVRSEMVVPRVLSLKPLYI